MIHTKWMICTYEWFHGHPLKEKVPDQCETLFSDDDGDIWQPGGKNQHDTNLVTLHRVKDFRALVPEGF